MKSQRLTASITSITPALLTIQDAVGRQFVKAEIHHMPQLYFNKPAHSLKLEFYDVMMALSGKVFFLFQKWVDLIFYSV